MLPETLRLVSELRPLLDAIPRKSEEKPKKESQLKHIIQARYRAELRGQDTSMFPPRQRVLRDPKRWSQLSREKSKYLNGQT